MQVCTSLQTNNHASTHFLQTGCPSCRPTNSVKALKAKVMLYCSLNSEHELTAFTAYIFVSCSCSPPPAPIPTGFHKKITGNNSLSGYCNHFWLKFHFCIVQPLKGRFSLNVFTGISSSAEELLQCCCFFVV